MLEVTLLPARQGDAIWVRWGTTALTHQMIVDMGTDGVGNVLRARLEALPAARRCFEMLVVTHIDSDHIGGVLSCLAEHEAELPALEIKDIWFNGLHHLKRPKKKPTLEEHGGEQGRRLTKWLQSQAWNKAFTGGRICLDPGPRTFKLEGELEVTLLGPPPDRLTELEPVWKAEIKEALRKRKEKKKNKGSGGLEAMGKKKPAKPELSSEQDLAALAAGVSGKDPSKPNGSSIVLLLKHGTRKVLLTGDAYAHDLVAAIGAHGEVPLVLDAMKLPHHGSRENTTKALIEAVDCPLFLFSTDGTQFFHPHAEAVACVIESARQRPAGLAFNCRSPYTEWWENGHWQSTFGYTARYGHPEEGFVLELD